MRRRARGRGGSTCGQFTDLRCWFRGRALTAAFSGVQQPANFTRLGHEFIIGWRPGCVVRGRAPRMAKRREGGLLDSENIAVPRAVASAVVWAVAWTRGWAHS